MVSDDQLIHDCRKGKKQAYSLLYKKYASVLLGMCMRYTQNRQEAQDVLQEGFIKIFQKIDTFQGKGSFEGWMKRIMVNTAINYYKKNKKYQVQESLDADHSRQVSNNEEEENVWVETEEPLSRELLLKLVNDLPAGYRLVFNMYVFEGLTHKEIAGELGISEGTSKSQLAKARKQLKTKVESYREKYERV